MGIDLERFVDSVPQEALCVVCCLVLEEPLEAPCGHFYCAACWWKRMNDADAQDIADANDDVNERTYSCAFCSQQFAAREMRTAALVRCLINNSNVYCSFKKRGCEKRFKYSLRELHEVECRYRPTDDVDGLNTAEQLNDAKCTKCKLPNESIKLDKSATSATSSRHDCITSLMTIINELNAQITNTDLEKSRIALKFMQREKVLMDRLAELEVKTHLDGLKMSKENRELRAKLATMQQELGKQDTDVVIEKIDLHRVNGSLGFNIIGGASKECEESSSGIFVSRIAPGGAADKPGLLKLHDQIVEVDGVDMTDAPHDLAVQTFRMSGDPVKIVIKRTVSRTNGQKSSETASSESQSSETPSDTKPSDNKAPDTDNKTDGAVTTNDNYDSAYDTLLTQKSYRSSASSQMSKEEPIPGSPSIPSSPTKEETKPIVPRTTSYYAVNGCELDSTLNSTSWIDSASELADDLDYEYEYEEVDLVKKEDTQFGLLLCYGGDATDVSVYVGDIEEGSAADHSNRIMVGDQIVKINGEKVINVDVAYQVLRDNTKVKLVVSRPVYDLYSSTYMNDDYPETDLDQIDDLEYLESIKEEKEPISSNESKSSSGGSNNGSVVQMQTIPASTNTTTNTTTRVASPKTVKHDSSTMKSVSSNSSNDKENRKSDSKSQCSENSQTTTSDHRDPLENIPKTPSKIHRSTHDSHDKKYNSLSREQKSKSRHSSKNTSDGEVTKKSLHGPMKLPSNSKSSGRSTPQQQLINYPISPSVQRRSSQSSAASQQQQAAMTQQMNFMNQQGYGSGAEGQLNMSPNAMAYFPNPYFQFQQNPYIDFPRYPMQQPFQTAIPSPMHPQAAPPPQMRSALKGAQSKGGQQGASKQRVQIDPHPGWNETERKVWEEFKMIQKMEQGPGPEGAAVNSDAVEAAWCVRRSKDGKQVYIKKRNENKQRSSKLKERANQINEERSGITTDDDAFTVYQGRYWSRDERRKQLLRHNAKKQRLLQKMNDKLLIDHSTERNLAETIQRKMTIPSKFTDDFLTVDEILSQRNRAGVANGFVHVTTI